MHLIVKLTKPQQEYILSRFDLKRSNKNYYKTLHLPNLDMHINMNPKKLECYSNFNATIHLHKGFFKRKELPESVKEILREIKWKINRLDISFDFYTDKQKSLLFKHDKRLVNCHYGNETYYIGFDKKNTEKRIRDLTIHYDRNCKLIKNNQPAKFLFSNRVEPRMRFPMKDMELKNIDHELVKKKINRIRFISNIQALEITKWQKNKLYKMQHNYEQFLSYTANEQRKLRKLIKESSEPLSTYYSDNIDDLFSVFSFLHETAEERTEPAASDYKLIDTLDKLLEPHRAALIDFSDLIGEYNRKKVDATSIQLRNLADQGYLTYEREEYGFRIEMKKAL